MLYRFPFLAEKPKDDKQESQEKEGWNLLVGCSPAGVASGDEFRRRVGRFDGGGVVC